MNNLHAAHVDLLKDVLYSEISDASKDAQGFRTRLDVTEYSVADLFDLADYYWKAASEAADEDERAYVRAIAKFEANIASVIASGAGDRETAIRWFRDANKDSWMGDESIRYELGLPWSYDFDHGDRGFFIRQAEEKNAARAREFEIECLQDMAA
jgi:hypothetical protein